MKLKSMSCAVLIAIGCFAKTAAAQTADVMHQGTSGGEAKAMAVLANEMKNRGGTWVDHAMVGGAALRTAAMSRIAGGNPPTAMQWQLGGRVDDLAAQGVIESLDDIAKTGNWSANLPKLITQKITVNGRVVAAPLNIHGVNWVFYNNKIFSDLKLEPPKTWDEFFVTADKIKAAGFIPLAHGGQGWQDILLFSNLMAGVGGRDFYRKIMIDFDGNAAGSATMVKVFDTYRRLSKYIDAGSPNRKWNDTTNLVLSNKAAMQIMGDWARAEFLAANRKLGQDFGCVLSPGTGNAYIISVDAFVFPKGNKQPDAAAARAKLANVIMDPAIQAQYSLHKGAIPARQDANITNLDTCAQTGKKVLSDVGGQLPAFNLAVSPDVEVEVTELVTKFWNTPSMTSAQAAKQFASIIASAKQ